MKTKSRTYVSRRQILQLLATVGITGPAALEIAAQSRKRVSPEALKAALAIIDQDLDDDRLRIVSRALQRNLDQFQTTRDLDIDDLIEPATVFVPRR